MSGRLDAGREHAKKSAASAACLDYAKVQSAIKAATRAAFPRGGRAGGRLDQRRLENASFGRASGQKKLEFSDSD